MARLTRAMVSTTIALTTALALTACTGDDDGSPLPPAEVALSIDGVEDMSLGLVVSSTSAPGEGADHTGPAAGAELAAYRLQLGDTPVDLTVVDDQGDADEAVAVVEDLVDQGVSGIVLATSGSHVQPALSAASAAGVPVVAPYLRTTEPLPDGVWVTGPSEDEISAGIAEAMAADQVDSPTVITADDVPVPAASSAAEVAFSGATLDDLLENLDEAVEEGDTDSIIVSAAASSQGAILAALQGAQPDLPVYQTPEALSPSFASSLSQREGTTSGRFVAIGAPATDTATLGSSDEASSAAAYFAALRLAAGDAAFLSGLDGAPFSELAVDADLPSHDAVLALVRAAASAESTDPAQVSAALAALTPGVEDSLAGPALDFTSSGALPAENVTPLYATTQTPGVRPADLAPALTWFPLGVEGSADGSGQ
ncbi:ABC transporter substrate-binding protein [Aeromicrobium sp. CF3.5]|uniref:ABC transporter substrate-binding protein n=1 Tax=Aeromicrobium sp. CF3.5 TaxID=3373078 RepID=UPI003EE813F7